ncbi:AMP-binding protein [Sciscionella sediminilitoris]|uniref:AMP-binding protein n=1 Tax=Sciscionella sediminilitoris TaxID=1445613 RepID=UPI0004DF352B|nr:AMP-binding protein [Sciscionella sp. SE31]
MNPRVYGAAHRLAELGAGSGARVAIDSPEPLDWLRGADLLGAASLIVDPAWTESERAAVFADARPDVTVTGTPPTSTEPVARQGDESSWFYLSTTSGSSGTPKVLVRTRQSWTRSFAALGRAGHPVLVPGPLSSSLFLFGALHALWCGDEPVLRPRLRLADARTAHTVHLVPAMLHGLLAELERHGGPCALRTVVCGGAHLGAELRERFAAVLPEAELLEYYGAAEHSLIALGVGELRPVPDAELDIRDGELWVRSPLACSGYLRSGRFHPAPEWSSVGDRVSITDGVLTVHGRGSAMLSTGGVLVSAEEVESVLRAVPGVDDALVVGTPHPALGTLVTAIVQAEQPLSVRELRAAARSGLAPAKRPRRWLVTKSLPRTSSGKPARSLATDRLAEGIFDGEPLR